MTTTEYDPVTRPEHYVKDLENGYQPIEFIRFLPYCRGAAAKYLFRAGRKDDLVQDLQKALQYVKWAIEYGDRGMDASAWVCIPGKRGAKASDHLAKAIGHWRNDGYTGHRYDQINSILFSTTAGLNDLYSDLQWEILTIKGLVN